MITINGTTFYEKPGSCGSCPFYQSPGGHAPGIVGSYGGKGFCHLWDENHNSYIAPPKRCQKLFNKAFRYPDGSELCIVAKEND